LLDVPALLDGGTEELLSITNRKIGIKRLAI
jgi:hypothetical protein